MANITHEQLIEYDANIKKYINDLINNNNTQYDQQIDTINNEITNLQDNINTTNTVTETNSPQLMRSAGPMLMSASPLRSISPASIVVQEDIQEDYIIYDRVITPNEDAEYKNIVVTTDDSSNRVFFSMYKTFDDRTLIDKHFSVIWINAAGYKGETDCVDIQTIDNRLYFAWNIPYAATRTAGTIKYAIRITTKDYVWNTLPADIECVQGLMDDAWEDLPDAEGKMEPKLDLSFCQITYDDNGHITSSVDITQAQLDALNSGVTINTLTTITDLQTTAVSLQNQINEIVRAPESGGDVGAEVYQARVGLDGTDYDTLKDRIDTEDQQIINSITFSTGNNTINNWVANHYIVTNESTVDINDVHVSDSNLAYAIIPCKEGDVFYISGTGGIIARLWCFIDGNNNVLANAPQDTTLYQTQIVAPRNSAMLILNDRSGGTSYKGELVPDVANNNRLNLKQLISTNNIMELDICKYFNWERGFYSEEGYKSANLYTLRTSNMLYIANSPTLLIDRTAYTKEELFGITICYYDQYGVCIKRTIYSDETFNMGEFNVKPPLNTQYITVAITIDWTITEMTDLSYAKDLRIIIYPKQIQTSYLTREVLKQLSVNDEYICKDFKPAEMVLDPEAEDFGTVRYYNNSLSVVSDLINVSNCHNCTASVFTTEDNITISDYNNSHVMLFFYDANLKCIKKNTGSV